MLRNARIALGIALLPAFVGFSGIFQATAGVARIICLILVGVAVLSLLFSLFEPAESPAAAPEPSPSQAPIQATLRGMPEIAPAPAGVALARLFASPERSKIAQTS